MYMSVIREHTPWTDGQPPYLGISRSVLALRILEAAAQVPSVSVTGRTIHDLPEMIMSLPDDDIADLNYIADEMAPIQLVLAYHEKSFQLGLLRRAVDEALGE